MFPSIWTTHNLKDLEQWCILFFFFFAELRAQKLLYISQTKKHKRNIWINTQHVLLPPLSSRRAKVFSQTPGWTVATVRNPKLKGLVENVEKGRGWREGEAENQRINLWLWNSVSVFVVLHISRHFNFLECPVALAADFYREPKKKKCQDHWNIRVQTELILRAHFLLDPVPDTSLYLL